MSAKFNIVKICIYILNSPAINEYDNNNNNNSIQLLFIYVLT
jgi:hypothetical protein